jgi:hypothetical protein
MMPLAPPAVVDDHLLPDRFRQLGRNHARDDVDRAAGREPDHYPERLDGKTLGNNERG